MSNPDGGSKTAAPRCGLEDTFMQGVGVKFIF